MIPLIRVLKPVRALTRCNYTTSSDQLSKLGHNVDPSELLSDEEIEFEVNILIRMLLSRSNFCYQLLKVEEVRIAAPYSGHIAGKW